MEIEQSIRDMDLERRPYDKYAVLVAYSVAVWTAGVGYTAARMGESLGYEILAVSVVASGFYLYTLTHPQ